MATFEKPKDIRHSRHKNTGFIGAIGEAIAWQYLGDKGIAAEALGANPSFFGGVGPKDRSRLEPNLTEEQIDFIFPPLDLEESTQRLSEWMRSRGSTEDEIRKQEKAWLASLESSPNSRGWLSWDFVGWARGWPVQQGKACLVEVKTSRPGKRPDQLRREGKKGMAPQDLREATRLGFVMLLLKVELTETWEAIVSEEKILADT